MATPLKGDAGEFVAQATREFERALTRVVGSHERAGRSVDVVLGDPRSFAERAVLAAVPEVSAWDELVGPFLCSAGVQARLGISRQAVAAKAARRRLLRTITADGVHLYPLRQFDGDSLVEGLAEVVSLFPGRRWMDGRWRPGCALRTLTSTSLPSTHWPCGERESVQAVARAASRSLAA